MKKIFTLLAFAITIFSFRVVAQTNANCNPKFSFFVTGDTVRFTPADTTTSNFIIYHSWNFGDGSAVQNVTAPSHIYSDTGTYVVVHYYYKALPGPGAIICSDSVKETVTITSIPCNIKPAFTWRVDTLTRTVYFDNTTFAPTTLAVPSIWFFGDDSSSTAWSATHTYAKPGTYYVCLRLQPSANCVKYQCDSITIPAPVVCNLQAYFNDLTDSLQYNKIHFTDYTTNLATTDSSYWTFGDSTTSRDVKPIHVYARPGAYNVCLTIKRITTPGTLPCTSTFCRTVTITSPICKLLVNYSYKIDSAVTTANTYQFTNLSTPLASTDSSYWVFGDGTTSHDINPVHTFAQDGTYTICLYVKKVSQAGVISCVGDTCKTTTITTPCDFKIGYTWTLDSVNKNEVHFTNTSAINTAASVRWAFGDNSPLDSIWNATHVFAQAGKYYVCLRIQVNPNCVKYQCDSITIPAPICNIKANYTWKIDSLNHNTVHFTNTSAITTTSGISVKWSFGDGSPLDSTWNTTHTYLQAGKYYVCLRVQITPNCVSYQCDSITVPAPVTCNIQSYFHDVPDSLQPNKIYFTNNTINLSTTDSSYWTFGDSTTSRDLNPTHVYAPGTYNACLAISRITIPGTVPCTSKFCRTIVIAPVCNLTANFTYYRDSLSASPVNNLYRFTNTSTPVNGYDSSFWNFGDGTNISYDKNPSHAFATSGTYTVCLYTKKASNSATVVPCVSSICETVVVPTICNIKANYTWKLDPAHANTVDFTNTTLPVPTTTVTSAKWSFGDGSAIDSTWNATHTYAQAGTYYVCLRVQTSATCVSYQCDSITVSAQVVPTCQQLSLFTIATPVLNKQYFVFAPTYPATDVQYTWTFGDNDGSQNITTSHHYTNPGVYTVCLTAYRDSNCATTTCKEITVRPEVNCDSINVSFNFYQNGSEPNMVYFYTSLNFPVTQESWTITNLANTAASPIILNRTNPVFVFTDTGYYNVCMHVTTIGGCVKEYCKTIHIASIATPCELYAYPNPTHTQVMLNVQLNTPEMIHVYVYTSQTVLLLQTEQQGNTGNNIITINTANLAAGFYTIKLIYGNNTCYAKFQKL